MSKVVIEKLGGLDILVNAAGVIFDGDIENTFPQDFDYIVDINVRCPFHLINLFLPFLKRSKGAIVNISATVSYNFPHLWLIYLGWPQAFPGSCLLFRVQGWTRNAYENCSSRARASRS